MRGGVEPSRRALMRWNRESTEAPVGPVCSEIRCQSLFGVRQRIPN